MTTHGMALEAPRQTGHRPKLVEKALADSEWSTVVREARQIAPDDPFGETEARPAAESARCVVERVASALGRPSNELESVCDPFGRSDPA